MNNLTHLRIILIGGTSHVGKSSVAKHIASVLAWEYLSTDRLAKHPGRPWRHDGVAVASHVTEHYAKLSVEELLSDVLGHYERNVLPQVETLVRTRLSDPAATGLVLEGSALWPGSIAPLLTAHLGGLWLTADDKLLTSRIHINSRYTERTVPEQLLIDKFLQRTLAYAHRMDCAITDHGLRRVSVSAEETVEAVASRCLWAVGI